MAEHYGKKINTSNSDGERIIQCTAGCVSVCQAAGVNYCKCKNSSVANKGSAYYTHYNEFVQITRSPTYS